MSVLTSNKFHISNIRTQFYFIVFENAIQRQKMAALEMSISQNKSPDIQQYLECSQPIVHFGRNKKCVHFQKINNTLPEEKWVN